MGTDERGDAGVVRPPAYSLIPYWPLGALKCLLEIPYLQTTRMLSKVNIVNRNTDINLGSYLLAKTDFNFSTYENEVSNIHFGCLL